MVCFSTLCVQVGHRLGFWGGFSCFVSFIWCELFACLIRAAIFRLLAWLGQPFFVCHHRLWFGLSFFLCPGHLWLVLSFFATGICVQPLSFTAFSAVGIRVRLFVFALVWRYQCTSQFLASCSALAARQTSWPCHTSPEETTTASCCRRHFLETGKSFIVALWWHTTCLPLLSAVLVTHPPDRSVLPFIWRRCFVKQARKTHLETIGSNQTDNTSVVWKPLNALTKTELSLYYADYTKYLQRRRLVITFCL